MSAAFVPTFTRQLATDGQGVGVAPRQPRHQRARSLITGGPRRARDRVRRTAGHRVSPASIATVPGKLELTVLLTRIMLPFLTFVALAAAVMGMLNSLHQFFIPALSPAMFNVATIVCAFALVPLMPALGLPAIAGDRHRHAARRRGAVRAAVAAAPPRGLRATGPTLDWQRRGTPARARADGTGHHRPGRDAGQRVRQHRARDRRGHGRGVVAELRVSPDVPADRPVRRLDCHGDAPGGVAARGAGRQGRPCDARLPTACR